MTTPEAAISALHFSAVVRNDPLLSLLPQPYHHLTHAGGHFGQHFDPTNADASVARFADGTHPANFSDASQSVAAFHHLMNFSSSSSSYLQRPPLIACRNTNAGPVRFCILAVDRLFDASSGDAHFEVPTTNNDKNNKPSTTTTTTSLKETRKFPLSSIDVRVRVELRAYGHLLAPDFITCSTLKGSGEFGDNGCWVTFPVGFAEAPVDTVACCTVIASSGDIVGGATFSIFDNSGAVISGGPWSYPLVKGVNASGSAESTTLVSPMQSRWDTASVLIKSGKLPGAKWMDDAAIAHIRRVQSALSVHQKNSSHHNHQMSGNNSANAFLTNTIKGSSSNNINGQSSHFWNENQEVQAVREELAQHQLRLEQEKINQQQISEEMGLHHGGAVNALFSSPALSSTAGSPSNNNNNLTSPEALRGNLATAIDHNAGKHHLLLYTSTSPMPVCLRLAFPTVSGNSKAVLVRTSTLQDGSDALQWLTSANSSVSTLHYPPNPTAYYPFKDICVNAAASMSLESKIPDEAGLCVKKAAILSRSNNFLYDPNAKPNAEQRRVFEEIAKMPPIQLGAMPEQHVALLWQFRHFVTREPQLLLPFVKSIDWNNEKERAEAAKIVRKWKQVSVADSLILLSKPFKGITTLREVAVNRLKVENDAQIGLVLLQLVQCIRYDDPESLDLFYFLMERTKSCWSICNFLYWYVRVECDLEEEQRQAQLKLQQQQQKSSGKKNQQQPQGGNQQNQEASNNNNVKYTDMMKTFVSIIEKEKPQYKKRFDGQEQLMKVLTKLYTSVAIKELDRKMRIEKSKKLIDSKDCGIAQLFDPQNPVTHGFVFLPSHPHIAVRGITSEGLYLFKSAKQPMLLPFIVEHGENIREHADIVGSGKEKEKTLMLVAETSVKGREEDQPKLALSTTTTTATTRNGASTTNPLNNNNNDVHDFGDGGTVSLEDAARLRAGTFAVFPDELPSDELGNAERNIGDNLRMEASTRMSASSSLYSSAAIAMTTANSAHEEHTRTNSLSSSVATTAAVTSSNNNNNKSTNQMNAPNSSSTSSSSQQPVRADKEKREAEKIGDVFKIMFKNGDDVRQDQLVIQVVEFADLLLRQNGLQLHLTPYRVLATSPTQGFVEFVPDVETLQDVQKQTVNAYLMSCVKDKPNAKELHRAQQEKFLKSCAGYGVITYLLGVGDRHLENLLVTKDGRLLHIDFGFILGKDPKPLPPPMKLNKEMVEAMGGVDGRDFAAFRVHSFTAYSVLRRHHTLFLALLLLMVDASMPNFDDDGKVDPLVNLRGAQEKLRLDLTDEADVRAFYAKIIQESLSARFTVLWDVIHVMAQNARA